MAAGLDRVKGSTAGRTWLGAVGVLVVAGTLVWTAGPVGLLPALLVAVLWYLGPGAYAVAAGHVASLPVAGELGLIAVVVLEAGFLAVLVAPVVRDRSWLVTLATGAIAALALGAVAWLGWQQWRPRWLVGLALAGLVALGLYAAHRYAVVSLELKGAEIRR